MNKTTKSAKKNIRKRNYSAIMVLVAGIVIGAGLIVLGIFNNVNSDYDTFGIKSEAEARKDVDDKRARLDELKKEREEEYNISAMSEKYRDLSREITHVQGELSDAEAELFNVTSGAYNNLIEDKIWSSVPPIVVGCAMIVFSIAVFFYMNNRSKRNVILSITEEE